MQISISIDQGSLCNLNQAIPVDVKGFLCGFIIETLTYHEI